LKPLYLNFKDVAKRTFIQTETTPAFKEEVKQLAKTHTNGNVTALVHLAINEFKNRRNETKH